MIKKYLEKYYQELYENKLNLEQEIQRLRIELNNNEKFTDTLKKSLEGDFESFSPRKVDVERHMEIDSLMEKHNSIYSQIENLQTKIVDIDFKLKELDGVLEYLQQNQEYIEVPLKQKEIEKSDLISSFTSLLNKIEICNKLFDVDTARCKLELQEIEKGMKNIINKFDIFL